MPGDLEARAARGELRVPPVYASQASEAGGGCGRPLAALAAILVLLIAGRLARD